MKDARDRRTGDLLASPGAQRQARYEARRKEQGFRRATVWLHEASWEAGRLAGMEGKPSMPVPAGMDGLSWISGYIQGEGRSQ